MKISLTYIVLFLCLTQLLHSQEDGVVAFDLPVRNSLKFNRYIINPTFSFVREQNKYITITNKRQWVQFDNAPQTYLFSYSGRFKENMGIGVGLFQQNYGVLTTFGGVANFAYNVVLTSDSNLTFGMNLGVYKSGINEGDVIINFPDPSLQNIPSNTLITVNPGINYGTAFLDFGVSINNLVAYNLKTSKLIEENPEQGIQAHIMYTGYLNSRGFFDESKFSSLVRSEFKKDQTVISGIMMLSVPKGFWGQVGYNTLYGASAGIGFNISTQISLEYNYEKEIGDLSTFGNSHEITLAYKFKNNNRYIYSGDDEESALITPSRKPSRPVVDRRTTPAQTKVPDNPTNNTINEEQAIADEEARQESEQENQARLAAEIEARAEEEARIKLAEEEAKALAEAKLKAEQETQTRLAAEEAARLIAEQETQAKLAAAQLKAEEEARIKLAEEEAQAKANEEARIKLEQEEIQNNVDEETDTNIDQIDLDDVNLQAKGNDRRELEGLVELTNNTDIQQQKLLIKLRETIDNRQQDLEDLKKENDLSEQGIYSEPKPFKSVSAENAALETLKLDLDNVISTQKTKISELESLYKERLKSVSNVNDPVNTSYQKTIQELKSKQLAAINTKESLLVTLEEIKVATEIERKRRIKRAVYDNEQDRYAKDRAALSVIKQNTSVSSIPLEEEDFDFGEEQSKNILILKGVSNVESGYYMVLAVHSDVAKRDEFLTKAVASGLTNINFFYDVNTSKYYIYHEKFDSIETANNALKANVDEPYNKKKSMVKIEN